MNQTKNITELEMIAKRLRCNVIEMIGIDHVGHLGGSCSIADVIAALYFSEMKNDPADPQLPDRDRFLLSKGHAALIQYSALAERGYFPKSELVKVKTLGAMLQGHPDMTKTPGIEANTGSLGQGLSVGIGMALGLRLDKSNAHIYVVVGDGELAEGQIWEAAMAASNFQVDNLTAILDRNKLQATGKTEDRFKNEPIDEKWRAFGWDVIEIDGHDMPAIISAIRQAKQTKNKPTIIIANTIKGKGVSFAECVVSFHNGAMTKEQYNQAKKDLS